MLQVCAKEGLQDASLASLVFLVADDKFISNRNSLLRLCSDAGNSDYSTTSSILTCMCYPQLTRAVDAESHLKTISRSLQPSRNWLAHSSEPARALNRNPPPSQLPYLHAPSLRSYHISPYSFTTCLAGLFSRATTPLLYGCFAEEVMQVKECECVDGWLGKHCNIQCSGTETLGICNGHGQCSLNDRLQEVFSACRPCVLGIVYAHCVCPLHGNILVSWCGSFQRPVVL